MQMTLEGIHPRLDGTYKFDESYFTNRELHAIRELTGLTAGKLEAAFTDLDNDLIMALAMVALMRAGKIDSKTPWTSQEVDALWNAPVGKIAMDFDEQEADARPPEIPSGNGVSPASESESVPTSGESSSLAGEAQDSAPSLTGSLLSDTGATSDPETSAS